MFRFIPLAILVLIACFVLTVLTIYVTIGAAIVHFVTKLW